MREVSLVDDGAYQMLGSTYEIVYNGNINVSSAFAIPVASNEQVAEFIDNYYTDRLYGISGYTEEKLYYTQTGQFLSDNISSSQENSITFEYSFTTMDGDSETGVITLPVH